MQATYVQIELLMEVLGCDRLQRQELVNAGIVHQDVELPVNALHFAEKARNVRSLRDVTLHRDGLPALIRDAFHHSISAGLAAGIIDHDGCAFRSQMLRNGCSDTFRSACDNRNFPGFSLLILFGFSNSCDRSDNS